MTKEDRLQLIIKVEEDSPKDSFWLERGFKFACTYKNKRIKELEDELSTYRAFDNSVIVVNKQHRKRIEELETVLKEIRDTYVDQADTDILEIIKEVIDE